MTTSTQGKLGTYATHQRGQQDARETDARALLSCANRLKEAIDDGGKDKKAYGDAVRNNQRLWTMFQIALCDPDNPLPVHLKANLLSISRYIDRVSFKSITSFMPEVLTEMIDINRRIAAGLSVKPKTAETPAAQPGTEVAAPQPQANNQSPAVFITTA